MSEKIYKLLLFELPKTEIKITLNYTKKYLCKSSRLVVDNLNTHNPASLYEVFSPEEARRIVQKLEFHYTPKHGSWLNQVEIEFSVLSRQCLERRIKDVQTLSSEIASWEQQRNTTYASVNWRFKTTDARNKLGRLYPTVSPSKVALTEY